MATGTLKSFDTDEGTGVIQPDDGSPDLPLHISGVRAPADKPLGVGDRVEFEPVGGPGALQAENVVVIG